MEELTSNFFMGHISAPSEEEEKINRRAKKLECWNDGIMGRK
jgi:hypothetical protein